VAAALKKAQGLQVNLVDGDRGEFTVSVDGKVVAQKGQSLPAVEEVVEAVRKAQPVGAGV
jgi:hypothetical protein